MERRHLHYELLSRRLVFVDGDNRRHDGIYKDGTHLFVFGDLNYRMDRRLEAGETWADNKASDELWTSHQEGKTLYGLVEEAIAFAPSFKFDESRKYEKNRNPSWCEYVSYNTTNIADDQSHISSAISGRN